MWATQSSQVRSVEADISLYHRVERGYGTFMRSFALPDDADFSNVNAEFKNGVLTVHVPKSEQAKPKQIEVKVA
jgi:HSP20 family protein